MSKRYFLIDTGRYGGEVCIGTIPADFVDYWNPKVSSGGETDLIGHIQGIEWEDSDEMDSDSPSLGENFYAWSECDDIEHLNGPYADSSYHVQEIKLHEDAEFVDGMVYWKDGVDHDYDTPQYLEVGEESGPHEYQCLYSREVYASYNEQQEDVEAVPVLNWHSGEKGCFGQVFIQTDGEDFDAEKFHCGSVETDCAEIIERYWYNQTELDVCWDWSDTNGKGFYAWVGYMNPDWHDKPVDEATITEYFEDWE